MTGSRFAVVCDLRLPFLLGGPIRLIHITAGGGVLGVTVPSVIVCRPVGVTIVVTAVVVGIMVPSTGSTIIA